MSDPPLSDIDFKIKMEWVSTTLNQIERFLNISINHFKRPVKAPQCMVDTVSA